MILARVIGTVWATRKDEKLQGLKLQIVRPVTLDYKDREGFLVAVDAVGAGVGETVFFVRGKEAAFPYWPTEVPADAGIVGIVDQVDVPVRTRT